MLSGGQETHGELAALLRERGLLLRKREVHRGLRLAHLLRPRVVLPLPLHLAQRLALGVLALDQRLGRRRSPPLARSLLGRVEGHLQPLLLLGRRVQHLLLPVLGLLRVRNHGQIQSAVGRVLSAECCRNASGFESGVVGRRTVFLPLREA